VLQYLDTFHNPTRTTYITYLQDYKDEYLNMRMVLSDDEKLLFIVDIVKLKLHILHLEDEFFSTANLEYQFSTFEFRIPTADVFWK